MEENNSFDDEISFVNFGGSRTRDEGETDLRSEQAAVGACECSIECCFDCVRGEER